jgi:hypothetical protein
VYKKYLICALTFFLVHSGWAQLGGQRSFEFLHVATSARLAAMGGVNISLSDRDVAFFLNNPALVSDSMAGYASAGYQFYVADIGQSVFAYAHNFNKIGTVSFGVQHIGYGEIQGYDASGLELGTFKSGETAIVISKSHQVSHFRMGINLKSVFSNIAGFRSSAVMLDLGGTFIHPSRDLTVGMVFKNIGFVFSEYSGTSDTRVPFDLQVGTTFKPEHMPIRFSLTVYNLASAGSAYDNPDDEEDDPGSLDKLLRHVTLGAEILIHRNVNILLGYNGLRQHELNTPESGGAGFSVGTSVNIKSFDLSVSRTRYNVGNAAYAFTLSADIRSMFFRKRI